MVMGSLLTSSFLFLNNNSTRVNADTLDFRCNKSVSTSCLWKYDDDGECVPDYVPEGEHLVTWKSATVKSQMRFCQECGLQYENAFFGNYCYMPGYGY